MTLLALFVKPHRRRRAHHNRLPSQARTTKPYYCPRCQAIFFTPPFISYKDNHTKICSDCSLIENMEATGMKAPYDGPEYWTIEQHLRAAAAEGLATSTQRWTIEQRLRATAAEGLATSTQQSAPCAGPMAGTGTTTIDGSALAAMPIPQQQQSQEKP